MPSPNPASPVPGRIPASPGARRPSARRSARCSALFLLPLAALALAGTARAETVNRIVLRVNDKIATLHDYQSRKRDFVQDISRREQDPAERRRLLSQAGPLVFKDLYEELLLHSRADQLAVEVTDEQVDRAMAQMRDAYGLKSDEEFRAAIAQSGLTEARLRTQMHDNVLVREVLGQEVNAKIKLEEDDLRRVYKKDVEQFRVPEQVDLREVVVLTEAVPAPEERAKIAADVAREVAAGKKLEEAVEPLHSAGKTSAVIDLGRVSPGDLDPGLEAAAWQLERGALSKPVEGRGGLHLLQVVERHASYVKPFSEMADAIRAREEERIYREKVAAYMAELRQAALIVANPPPDAVGYESLLGTSDSPTDEFNVGRASTPAKPGAAGDAKGSTSQAPLGARIEDAIVPGNDEAGTAAESAPEVRVVPVPPAPGEPGALPEPKPVDPTPEDIPPTIPPPTR